MFSHLINFNDRRRRRAAKLRFSKGVNESALSNIWKIVHKEPFVNDWINPLSLVVFFAILWAVETMRPPSLSVQNVFELKVNSSNSIYLTFNLIELFCLLGMSAGASSAFAITINNRSPSPLCLPFSNFPKSIYKTDNRAIDKSVNIFFDKPQVDILMDNK